MLESDMPDTNGSATVGAHEVKANLGQLLDRVTNGEEIIITRHRAPIARLVPFGKPANRAQVGENLAELDAIAGRIKARGVALSQADIRDAIESGRP